MPLSLSHLLTTALKQEERDLVCTCCPYFLVLSLLCHGPKHINNYLSRCLNLAKRPSVSKMEDGICDSYALISSWMLPGLRGNQLSLLAAERCRLWLRNRMGKYVKQIWLLDQETWGEFPAPAGKVIEETSHSVYQFRCLYRKDNSIPLLHKA